MVVDTQTHTSQPQVPEGGYQQFPSYEPESGGARESPLYTSSLHQQRQVYQPSSPQYQQTQHPEAYAQPLPQRESSSPLSPSTQQGSLHGVQHQQNGQQRAPTQQELQRQQRAASLPEHSNQTGCDRLAHGLQRAGELAVSGLGKATPVVAGQIEKGGVYAKERIEPNETPANVNVDNVRKVRGVTSQCAEVSGKVANKFVGAARKVGSRVQGSGNKEHTGVRKVAVTGVVAASNVLEAATDAFKSTLDTSCDTASGVVGHKYGEQAQEASREGLHCVQDAVVVGLNVQQLGPKGLAKAAVKQNVKDRVVGK